MKVLALTLFLLFNTVFTSANCFAEQTVVHVGEDAELFRQWQRVQDNYQLIKGRIIFQESDSEFYSKGYRVEDSSLLLGAVTREIYDYRIEQSSSNVFDQVRKSLNAQGFSEQFVCSGGDCGEVDGWRLYLHDLIGYQTETQHYIAAVKHNEASAQSQYVAVYVNDIDGQPRTLVDVITKPTEHRFDVVVNTNDIAKTIEKDGKVVLSGIYFETDSATLDPSSLAQVKAMSEFIKAHQGKQFAVVGHTDNVGSGQYNEQLAKNRAQAVVKLMLQKFDVKPQQVMAKGLGPYAPVTSNSDENGKALNRRVELILL
ncbi:OmpA family protein [Pleionea litopenaei]|uniref:OmpA family protein n=1 Tax=Pleionea litopenaei TaxID=3070815 RepID=A0AA51RTF1_9GAMM|nr:OmpA family protein [Pleionea sp. HL-JVS1]WMS87257.1 OmpA family protein [Pleionea sp. HL-JVS1]